MTPLGVSNMKTFISMMILSFSFLSAGAFAGNPLPLQIHKAHAKANVTVVYKNATTPTLIEIGQRACKINACREA
jgi:hypothetical protein